MTYIPADSVVVPGRVAALLIDEGLIDLGKHLELRGFDPELDRAMENLRKAARCSRPASDVGSSLAGTPVAASSSDLMTTSAAAEYLGITPSAVRQAARKGTLRGTQLGAGWVFTRTDLDHYRNTRTT